MIKVSIQNGNHVTVATVPALPRVGDRIACEFPSSGIPRLFLQVTRVHFNQPHGAQFDGKACTEPFSVSVVTEDDPDPELQALNAEVFRKLMGEG